MGTPFKMKGSPMQRNFGFIKGLKKGIKKIKTKNGEGKKTKGVTKGDVIQTLVAPRVNIPKTMKVIKHGVSKVKKYLKSPA